MYVDEIYKCSSVNCGGISIKKHFGREGSLRARVFERCKLMGSSEYTNASYLMTTMGGREGMLLIPAAAISTASAVVAATASVAPSAAASSAASATSVSAASVATAPAAAAAVAAAASSSAAAVLAALGNVHLDGLAAIDGDAVQFPDCGLGGVLVNHGDKGVALAGIVDIGNFTAPAKLVLQDLSGAVFVDPIDEEL